MPLKSMDGGDDGILKKLLKTVFVYGLGLIDPVFDKSKDMMAEMAWMDGTNPYNGDISLPGNDVFELVEDESENTIEYLSLTLDTSNASFDATIDGGIHTVGFGSNPHAAYATTFKITVDGQIGYTVTGTGALSGAMNSLYVFGDHAVHGFDRFHVRLVQGHEVGCHEFGRFGEHLYERRQCRPHGFQHLLQRFQDRFQDPQCQSSQVRCCGGARFVLHSGQAPPGGYGDVRIDMYGESSSAHGRQRVHGT